LTQLYAPPVERIDLPDGALRKRAVLVQRDQRSQDFRREPLGEKSAAGPVALEHAVRHEPLRRSLRPHVFRRLAEGERPGAPSPALREGEAGLRSQGRHRRPKASAPSRWSVAASAPTSVPAWPRRLSTRSASPPSGRINSPTIP